MSMVKISNMPARWDAPTIEYTAIKMNVTDVASSGSSKLIDLQVNGASVFNVRKDGAVTANGVTGSMVGTASYATVALNANNSISSSYSINTYYSETAMSSSHAVDSDFSISASFSDKAGNVAFVSAPATTGSTGNTGDVAVSASYLYVCVSTDSWMRTALSGW